MIFLHPQSLFHRILIGQTSLNGSTGQYPQLL